MKANLLTATYLSTCAFALIVGCTSTRDNAPIAFLNAQDEIEKGEKIGTAEYFPTTVAEAEDKFDTAIDLYDEAIDTQDSAKRQEKISEAAALANKSYSLSKQSNTIAVSIPEWDRHIEQASLAITNPMTAKELNARINDLSKENANLKSTQVTMEEKNSKLNNDIVSAKELSTAQFARMQDFRFGGSVAFFPSQSSQMDNKYLPNLSEIANSLAQSKDLKIKVTGYADRTGNPERNRVLSMNRAEEVRNILVGKGIAKDRIAVEGDATASEESNKRDRSNNAQLQLDRRTDLSVYFQK